MNCDSYSLDGRSLWVISRENPVCLILQPADSHDAELLDRQSEELDRFGSGYLLAAFSVRNWQDELSPWKAPPVFGKESFGQGAERTLDWILNRLLPDLFARYSLPDSLPVVLGGYSLAGLFALWSGTRTPHFSAIAAASPSVWFPGWLDYAEQTPMHSPIVYLSLGDREERTRNPVMATVGRCIQQQASLLLKNGHCCILEWNEGNHFRDSELRCAKAFGWCMDQLRQTQ